MKKLLIALLTVLLCAGNLPMNRIIVSADEEEMITVIPEEIHVSENEESNDDLLSGYIQHAFDENLESIKYGPKRGQKNNGSKLTGVNRVVYDKMAGYIKDIAAGRITSTEFLIPVSELGVQTYFTKNDLGMDIIVDGHFNDQALDKAVDLAFGDFDILLVNNALMLDYPYEMYWYDKTRTGGVAINYGSFGYNNDGTYINVYGNMKISYSVAQEFAVSQYIINPTTGTMITNAINNANRIVRENVNKTDYQKIKTYKDEICALVSYNKEAAYSGNVVYGNPWQLLWVFDGDTSTNVVCEGYSKAFQYLCDVSGFVDNLVCYSVSGNMGTGAHMWNIVNAHDNKNYLVDVTNCDSGTIGQQYALFMVGIPANDSNSSVDNGYTFNPNGGTVKYTYDEYTRKTYTDEELTIAKGNYVAPEQENPIVATSLTLNKEQMELRISETETLFTTLLPENATHQELEWESSDQKVATVDQNGVVTAVGVGTATITAATTDGTQLTATCEVTVKEAETAPEFSGHSMVLSGQIGVDFGIKLPDEVEEYEGSYFIFTIGEGEKQETKRVEFDSSNKLDDTRYKGTVYISSIRMADK
ncbi:MAG: hypothetical protein E7187_06110, partial [Erysipelotrichaceae bacterium]|nr:hypothetical protein [Erysipelotrichaceae bacterium]